MHYLLKNGAILTKLDKKLHLWTVLVIFCYFLDIDGYIKNSQIHDVGVICVSCGTHVPLDEQTPVMSFILI